MVKAALQLAKITSVDPFGGLPEPSELGKLEGDLKLYDEAIGNMTTEWKIDQAMRAEKAAFDYDPRDLTAIGDDDHRRGKEVDCLGDLSGHGQGGRRKEAPLYFHWCGFCPPDQ